MNTMKDRGLARLQELTALVRGESIRQIGKWGYQNRTPFEWMTYLTEEVGELAEAISENHYRDGDRKHVAEEAIQVATLALKIAEGYIIWGKVNGR